MASNTLHHRLNNDQPISTKPTTTTLTKQEKAKRALRSLAIGIAIPLTLTTTTIFFFGWGPKYRTLTKPFWLPPLWLINYATFFSSFLMGLSAWLVWADGGFHAQSNAFVLYIAQVSLSILWGPVLLAAGAAWLGLAICLMNFGALFACYKCFRCVNPFAKDLVKPYLAWAACLAIVNCKLLCLGF
ncbi:unnamed protein product [Prunus armeniaca]|uniref:TspO/MBR-related protein n=1 Tax=Prunus armeniaca TaxID=36596 RepID=A0A6J5W554_PRUAR|nr:unnamed protein product [Prunus armeniaca]